MASKFYLLRFLILVVAIFASAPARADLNDCQNLYVGRIWVEKGAGLKAIVLLTDPVNSSGSYWVHFNDWTVDERAHALALLTSAKLSKHKVNVATQASDGCSITTTAQVMQSVYISTNP